MEQIVSRENMMTAYQRVVANKGAPGIDKMTVEQLKPYLVEHWPRIKEELLDDRYQPAPVRGKEIPKPGGKGVRLLGIPTVVDRLIQQALHQVLMPIFDPDFFLGYSMTHHMKPRLRVAAKSAARLRDKLRATFRQGRGRTIGRTVETLTPILRGWINYFRLAQVKGTFEELDGWLRRKLRCLLWRQWKRPRTRKRNLMARGLDELRAWHSASNGRGPWWNAGASHMNDAYRKSYFDTLGLPSLLDHHRRLNHAT